MERENAMERIKDQIDVLEKIISIRNTLYRLS